MSVNTVTMGTSVHATDGAAGRVDDVLVSNETGQPAYLVVDAGGFFKGDVVLSVGDVQSVNEDGVWVALTRDQVKKSPSYDPGKYGSSAGLRSRAAARHGRGDR